MHPFWAQRIPPPSEVSSMPETPHPPDQAPGPATVNAGTRSDDALRISEQTFRSSFDSAPIGMALVGPDGQWLRVNRQICHIVGYPEQNLLRLTFQDITHPDDLDADLELMHEVLEGRRDTYQMEKRYFHRDGHVVPVLLSVSAVRDTQGQILHFVSQITDISALKLAEEKTQALLSLTREQNARLRQFAHIVAHNLRSHSNGLSGLLEIVRQQHPELAGDEALDLLGRSALHLKQTIADLTEVVSAELGDSPAASVLLADRVRKNLESLAAMLSEAGVTPEVRVPETHQVYGIPAYVDSVILNLLTNAIKYLDPDRAGRIRVYTESDDDNVTLYVQDNGLGIDLARHGDRLFSLYSTFHRHPDSRGVGLFISKSQVESMGGQLRVSSTPGVGSCFSVTLPGAPPTDLLPPANNQGN